MFHGWPHELDGLPLSKMKVLENYYWTVKDAEQKAREGSDSDDEGLIG
jgi:hypothetical protein